MIRLQPDWIGELLSVCAADERAAMHDRLNYPAVSPMFARLLPNLAEADEAGGYSSLEVRACKAGLEWMAREHPALYAALAWEFQTWRRAQMPRAEDHERLAMEAGLLLAKFVDGACS